MIAYRNPNCNREDDRAHNAAFMPLSPVFDGDHGVMIIAGAYIKGSSRNVWAETFDGGMTWELRGIE